MFSLTNYHICNFYYSPIDAVCSYHVALLPDDEDVLPIEKAISALPRPQLM
ncbi:hypothetical protein LSH36_895g01031 [Paralvinella palmiformis]|uniref:Uncharacterized protein n=1 Tax=Paralvinella palmiformis TaxID=53620 RepID=A0AAD9IZF9_9ANNE|nr:hypothetical protein LSH36_895g01031 [Paralvinella palmiformis]